MRVKVDGFELLIAMAIVALGEFNGGQFEYFPILPKPFCDNLDFQSSCGCNADFLCIRRASHRLWQVDRAASKGAITRRFLSEQTEIIKKLGKSWDFIWLSQLFFVPLHYNKQKEYYC